MKKHIANGFTLLNLFFGCVAIVYILKPLALKDNYHIEDVYIHLSLQMRGACLFILLAGIVDFLDGLVARMLGIASTLGKELDSLADTVSFGVAPALIVYQYLNVALSNGGAVMAVGAFSAFIIACCGAFRLARFNITQSDIPYFEGVPIPVAALLTASLPMIYIQYRTYAIGNLFHHEWFWYVYIIFISGLMVSKMPMMSLKFKRFSLRKDWLKIVVILLVVLVGFLLKWLSVPVLFLCYILLSFYQTLNKHKG